MQRPDPRPDDGAGASSSASEHGAGHDRRTRPGAAGAAGCDGGGVPGSGRTRRRDATPAQRALGLLVRREHSQHELVAKLTARGIDPEDAGRAVARMTAEGWQDDTRFAVSLARMRSNTGYGPVRIRSELETHRVGPDAIELALAALADSGDADWPARARALACRRYGEGLWDDRRLQRKAADFLFRRGFDADSVRNALRPGD